MVLESNERPIIEEKLKVYEKAETLPAYQRAIKALNKHHDPAIAAVFWSGLKSKKVEDFPLVAFFATVSALEAYGKTTELLDIFIERWQRDYEEKMLNDLTQHRAIEVIHIIINEAFQSYRNDEALHNLLLEFFEKKTLRYNGDGLYKTIDSFKFFPKKLGANVPPRLLEGLIEIIAKYFQQELLGGKNNREILTYIDFFTDRIDNDEVIQIVKKVEKQCKSELFCMTPGGYIADDEKGEVYATTALPYFYHEDYREKERCKKEIDDILLQLDIKESSMLLNIETEELQREIEAIGLDRFLEKGEQFCIPSESAIDVLGKLPPIVPAFLVTDNGKVAETVNAKYATKYCSINNAAFILYGHTVIDKDSKWDMIDGVIVKVPTNSEKIASELTDSDVVKAIEDNIEVVVSDVSVEVKGLNLEKENFLKKSLDEENVFENEPFLGFRGEKERQYKKRDILEKREAFINGKDQEIITAFELALKTAVIKTEDNINSISALNRIVSRKDEIIKRLTEIKGTVALSAEIIKDAIVRHMEHEPNS